MSAAAIGKGKRVVVIGGGIGGYAAALRAARAGAETTLIERDKIGGVCLNKGCIPTKVYLHASTLLHEIARGDSFGLRVGASAVDFPALTARKNAVVSQLTGGVAALLRAAKVRVIAGAARFSGPKTVFVEEAGESVEGDVFILATGSTPSRLSIDGADKTGLLTSDDLIALETPPKSLVIIGGGYIGVELGQFFSRIGVQVTIVERTEALLPTEDREIADALLASLRKEGLEILTGAEVVSVAKTAKGKSVTLRSGGKERRIEAAEVAQTVGRSPNTDGLGLEKIGVKTARGAVVVDARMRTSAPHIFAVGDCTGGVMLAHVASAEAECAVENAFREGAPADLRAIPRCVYTEPEIACVGLTEAQAKAKRGEVRVARFPLHAVGKALIAGGPEGVIKVVADTEHGEILGVHMIGPHVTEMIAESVLAIGLECTAQEVARAIHPHPTISEGMGEAAMMLAGGALHLP